VLVLPSMPRGLRTMALSSLLATWEYPRFPRQASGSESSLMRPQGILTRAPEDFEASGAKGGTGCLSGPQKWYSWPSATRTLSGFNMQAKFKTVSPHCRTGQKPSHPSRERWLPSLVRCPALPVQLYRTAPRCAAHRIRIDRNHTIPFESPIFPSSIRYLAVVRVRVRVCICVCVCVYVCMCV